MKSGAGNEASCLTHVQHVFILPACLMQLRSRFLDIGENQLVPHQAQQGQQNMINQVVTGLSQIVQGQASVLGQQFQSTLQSQQASAIGMLQSMQETQGTQMTQMVASLGQQHRETTCAWR